MPKYNYLIIVLTIFMSFSSCVNEKKERIAKVVNEWKGREIIFPDSFVFVNYNKDTVQYDYENKYKLLVYVDSLSCSSCVLKLDAWHEMYEALTDKSKEQTAFIFVLCPRRNGLDNLYKTLKGQSFQFPVVLDYYDTFNKLNTFPQEEMFHSMLLDQSNRVILMGNPTYNKSMTKLFKNTLNKCIAKDEAL